MRPPVISSEARTEISVARAAAQVIATFTFRFAHQFRWRGAARFLGSCLTRNDGRAHWRNSSPTN